jgi:hypothetical protein
MSANTKSNRPLTWIKTCIVIHTLVNLIEHRHEDRDFVMDPVHEGTNNIPDRVEPCNDGPSDTLQEMCSQSRHTQLKNGLLRSPQ